MSTGKTNDCGDSHRTSTCMLTAELESTRTCEMCDDKFVLTDFCAEVTKNRWQSIFNEN